MKSLKYLLFAFALAAGLSFAGDREDADAAMWRGEYAVALKKYRTAALKSDAEAQFAIGNIYREGLGVKKSDSEAVSWYRLSAEHGFAKAQYVLAEMYEKGHGVAKDDA